MDACEVVTYICAAVFVKTCACAVQPGTMAVLATPQVFSFIFFFICFFLFFFIRRFSFFILHFFILIVLHLLATPQVCLQVAVLCLPLKTDFPFLHVFCSVRA
jgi:hypothetical protein